MSRRNLLIFGGQLQSVVAWFGFPVGRDQIPCLTPTMGRKLRL